MRGRSQRRLGDFQSRNQEVNYEIHQEKNIKDGVSLDSGMGKEEFGLDLCLRKSKWRCRLGCWKEISGVCGSKLDYLGRELRTLLLGPQEFRMQEEEDGDSGKDFKVKKDHR